MCALLVAAAALVLTAGCEELSSRRQIQKGNKLYQDGKYAEAVDEFEEALERTPDLPIGHHNLGLAYYKQFRAGDMSPANLAYAAKAAEHFAIYLESEPEDGAIVSLMTRIWLDSDQYDKALAYWEAELDKEPTDVEIIQILAGINRQAGKWRESVQWHYRQAEVDTSKQGQLNAYMDISKLAWHKLSNKDKVIDMERLEVADTGIAALQKALALEPEDLEQRLQIHAYMASMYDFRSLIHGVSWAQAVDKASMQRHRLLNKEIGEKLKAEKAAGSGKTDEGGSPESGS